MTISTTQDSVVIGGNGSTTSFSFPFVGVAASDISVVYTDASGNQTTLSPSQYSVTFNPLASGQIWQVGGAVTYPLSGSPIAVGTTLTISRTLPLTQTTSIANQGDFYPQVVEQALDTLCMQIQQISAEAPLSIRAPASDGSLNILPPAAKRANQALLFDANGQPVVGAPGGSGIAISTAMQPIVAAASIPAAEGLWEQGLAAPGAPSSPSTYQRWMDTSTTPHTLRIYDGAQWLAVATIDTANHVWTDTPKLAVGMSVNTTLTIADVGKTFTSGAVNLTATLPALTAVPDGAEFEFQCQNPTFTIAANAADANTMYGPNGWGVSSFALDTAGAVLKVKKQAGNWLVVQRMFPFAAASDVQAGTSSHLPVTPAALAGAILGSPSQSWHDVTGSRALGTVYTNSTGRPIVVEVGVYNTSGGELEIINGGVTRGYAGGATGIRDIVTTVVRAGDTYEFAVSSGAFSMTSWAELS